MNQDRLTACAQPYNPGSISPGPSVIDQASGQGVEYWPSPFLYPLILTEQAWLIKDLQYMAKKIDRVLHSSGASALQI